MHFTHHTKVNDEMEFHYYKKFFKSWSLKRLGFATKHPLQLNDETTWVKQFTSH
jgi:hypothetical protein